VEFGTFLAIAFDLVRVLIAHRESGAHTNYGIKICIYPTN